MPHEPLVLIVEDHEDMREMSAQALALSGMRPVEAGTAAEALTLARERKPDCVLLDLSLPDGDGWVVAQQLGSDPQTRAIPVIALTGHRVPPDAAQMQAAGFAAVLIKPCLPDELVGAVSAAIARSSADRTAHRGS